MPQTCRDNTTRDSTLQTLGDAGCPLASSISTDQPNSEAIMTQNGRQQRNSILPAELVLQTQVLRASEIIADHFRSPVPAAVSEPGVYPSVSPDETPIWFDLMKSLL